MMNLDKEMNKNLRMKIMRDLFSDEMFKEMLFEEVIFKLRQVKNTKT